MNGGDNLTATQHAEAVCEHIQSLNRATLRGSDQTPSQTAEQVALLAASAAALPQAFAQLSALLERALTDQILSMDSDSLEPDPAMAVGIARLHLDEARGHAVDLYKRLDAAHQATAHIISAGVFHPENPARPENR